MMNKDAINLEARSILNRLCYDPGLGKYIDARFGIPEVYCGSGEIRLIVLGQDPTVKNPRSRGKIQVVLNLDPKRKGNLWNYLNLICQQLGLDLSKNVYATNLFKNFFVEPPTQIKEIDIFHKVLPYWLPLLKDELAEFPSTPVITLGEPLLSALVVDPTKGKVRDYWGYTDGWKRGERKPFSYLAPGDNILGRAVFPFPHQPSLRKVFYRDRLQEYIAFSKQAMD